MTNTEVIQKFLEHDWYVLWQWSNQGDSPLQLAARGFLYVSIWGDVESSRNTLSQVKHSSDIFLNFLISLGHLTSGNQEAYEKAKTGSKKNTPDWIKYWIKLDLLARKKQHKLLSEQCSKLMNKAVMDELYRWVYPAILNVLETSSLAPNALFDIVASNEPIILDTHRNLTLESTRLL